MYQLTYVNSTSLDSCYKFDNAVGNYQNKSNYTCVQGMGQEAQEIVIPLVTDNHIYVMPKVNGRWHGT